ncbi:MAG: hypothetical protein GKR89_04640 [Candidatus Latescibacteria bacterium]|nr:hypothetical protein [Candidatus Latescibacterota bacterium]
MPSNYTIAQVLKRVAYYRDICAEDPGNYPDAAWMIQGFAGGRLDELYPNEGLKALERTNEYSDEVLATIAEVIEDKPVNALSQERQGVPLTVLDIVDIKGVGAVTARTLFEELGVADLPSLRVAINDNRIGQVKGFGAKTIEKITAYLDKKGL